MRLNDDHPDQPRPVNGPASRLNLLLSWGGWRRDAVVDQLPRLLEPLGIRTIRVDCGQDAADVIRHDVVHIAVVDLEVPLSRGGRPDGAGGTRTLELLRRLEQPPPTVVVRPPQPEVRESVRGLLRALRGGAFTVLDRPLQLEPTLEVMRRILRRHYAGAWPAPRPDASERNDN